MTVTAVRTGARTGHRRPVPHQRRESDFVGVWGLAALQSAPSVDCVLALFVGLLGGAAAGFAMARLQSSQERDQERVSPTFRPPSVSPDRSGEGMAFEEPSPPAGAELTDEETVLQLLVSNGGRMKQSRIVENTDWSKAKVSRLLSSMEEREEITKLTHGRENLIFLGTVDEPNVSGSPLDR